MIQLDLGSPGSNALDRRQGDHNEGRNLEHLAVEDMREAVEALEVVGRRGQRRTELVDDLIQLGRRKEAVVISWGDHFDPLGCKAWRAHTSPPSFQVCVPESLVSLANLVHSGERG